MELSSTKIYQSERIGLFEDILKGGSDIRVKVTGSSMFPFLNTGEIVTLKKVPPHSLRVGDILFFKDTLGHPTLHRLIDRRQFTDGKIVFQTKGDALIRFDEPISDDRFMGKVSKIEKINRGISQKYINLETLGRQILNFLIAIAQRYRSRIYYVIFLRMKTKFPSVLIYYMSPVVSG